MTESDKTFNTSFILKSLLDNSPEGVILLSPECKVLTFNNVIKDFLFKLFKNEIKVGDDYINFISPTNKESFQYAFKEALEGKTTKAQVKILPESDSVWIEIKMGPLYSETNDLIGIFLYLNNIDSQKKAEIELEDMAKNYMAIFDNVDESIFFLDKNYKVLNFNKFGYDRLKRNINKEVFIGADFKEYIYQGQEEVFAELFNKALSGLNAKKEIRVKAGDHEAWFLSKMFPVYDRNGNLLGVSVYAVNIHDRKIAEIALKESEEKFRSIVESAPSPIIIVDKEMKIVLSNPGTEKVFGYSSKEIKNQSIEQLIPSDYITELRLFLDKDKNTSESLILGKEGFISAKRKNEQDIYIEATLNHIHINKEQLLLIMILDVTERIKAEQKILNQLKRLEAIAWEQSHELRRPVANILGLVNLFKMSKNLSESDKQKFLDNIFLATKDLDEVIHKIVDYTND